jgi:S-(hydroxymethyl)glutathione dehydrogenase/alcohol dehydrogenase
MTCCPPRNDGWRAASQELINRTRYDASGWPRRDFPWLAKLYLDGVLDLNSLVTERIRLADINRGFERMRKRGTIRSVVETG